MITHINPLRILVYDDYFIRLCTQKYEKFSKENKKNGFIHLTNMAVNKHNKNAKIHYTNNYNYLVT